MIDIIVSLGDKSRFYLVDGGPISHAGAPGDKSKRKKALEKSAISKPYYQYLLRTLTDLATIPNTNGMLLI